MLERSRHSAASRDATASRAAGMRTCTRFSLITATNAGSTREFQSRSGLRSADDLEDVPDSGRIPRSIDLPLTLIRHFSGEGLAVPEIESERDRAILARVLSVAPPLGGAEGWGARFGRELNATDDRPHVGECGLPVLDGKHIERYRVRLSEASRFIERRIAGRLLGPRAGFDAARLGYREVASSTNRLTLIAAVIP